MDYEWLTPDFYSAAYDRFVKLWWKNDPFPGENHHLDPQAFIFSSEEMKNILPVFGHSLVDLSIQSIVGQINGFHSDVYKLKAWEKILPEYAELQRWHLIDEFVEPLVLCCLIAPDALKNQIIFSGTQIGILLDRGKSQQEIPKEWEIKSIDQLKPWAGAWTDFASLEKALKAISSQDFRNATKNFRNRYSHRLPPSIEIGVAPNYRFVREGHGIRICGGNEPPLPLSTAIEASVIQHRACVTAFLAFWTMLKARLA